MHYHQYKTPKYRPSLIKTFIARFREENMAMVSAALAFTTLLALVPLITVAFSIASAFPYFEVFVGKLDGFFVDVLLPSKSGKTIVTYVMTFVQKSRRLTGMGLVLLGATSFFLLSTIERTFNHLWRAKQPRPLLRRLRMYTTVILLGPFILGAMAGAMSFAVTTALGFMDEPTSFHRDMFKYAPLLLLWGFFAFLYHSVPNAQVAKHHALLGSFIATILFALMQKGFELYLTKFAAYSVMYGSFSAMPIFLLWLYLSWVVIMAGALFVATMSGRAQQR
jgi:membrane protein